MKLTPREIDHLLLHQCGSLAQKRLARGLKLNHSEATALIATVVLELIRDGKSCSELMDLGRKLLGKNQVMSGVDALVDEVQVEGTFPDGTKLVTVHDPISMEDGDLALALYGSFLPVPKLSAFAPKEAQFALTAAPGALICPKGDIIINMSPKSWWQIHGAMWPTLQPIATRVFSVGTSSSASERNFSTWSHIWSNRANSLSFERAIKIVYVYTNLRTLQHIRSGTQRKSNVESNWLATEIETDED